VLILNASYEPLHVCSVKRAVSLLMHEVAERVEESGKVLRSPNAVFPVPSVIRLKRFVRTPFRQRVAFNRKNVFRRDDHVCQYCGRRTHDLTLDHVIPRSRGGPTTWENVVACCKPQRQEARPHAGGGPHAPAPAALRPAVHVHQRLRRDARHRPDLGEVPAEAAALSAGAAGRPPREMCRGPEPAAHSGRFTSTGERTTGTNPT